MIQLNPKRFVNAAAKARQVKLYVRMFAWRQYGCRTPQGHVYTVRFETKASGTYAHCNCAAGAKNLPCYHVAACYSVDVVVVTMRMEHVRQLEERHRATDNSAPALLVKPQPPSRGRINGIEL
jgi:hypothetical protein